MLLRRYRRPRRCATRPPNAARVRAHRGPGLSWPSPPPTRLRQVGGSPSRYAAGFPAQGPLQLPCPRLRVRAAPELPSAPYGRSLTPPPAPLPWLPSRNRSRLTGAFASGTSAPESASKACCEIELALAWPPEATRLDWRTPLGNRDVSAARI